MDILSANERWCKWLSVGWLSKLDGGEVETLKTVLLVGVDVTGGENWPICWGRKRMLLDDGGVVIPDGIKGLARPVDGGGLLASAALFSGDDEADPFIE